MLALLPLSSMLSLVASAGIYDVTTPSELINFTGEWTAVKTYGDMASDEHIPQIKGCLSLKIRPTGQIIRCKDLHIPKAETTLSLSTLLHGKFFHKEIRDITALIVVKNHDDIEAIRNIDVDECAVDGEIGATTVYNIGKDYFVWYAGFADGALFGRNISIGNGLTEVIEKVNGVFKDTPSTTWYCDV